MPWNSGARSTTHLTPQGDAVATLTWRIAERDEELWGSWIKNRGNFIYFLCYIFVLHKCIHCLNKIKLTIVDEVGIRKLQKKKRQVKLKCKSVNASIDLGAGLRFHFLPCLSGCPGTCDSRSPIFCPPYLFFQTCDGYAAQCAMTVIFYTKRRFWKVFI